MTAVKLGVSDLFNIDSRMVKVLGIYIHYIRTPRELLPWVSSVLSGDGVMDSTGKKPSKCQGSMGF